MAPTARYPHQEHLTRVTYQKQPKGNQRCEVYTRPYKPACRTQHRPERTTWHGWSCLDAMLHQIFYSPVERCSSPTNSPQHPKQHKNQDDILPTSPTPPYSTEQQYHNLRRKGRPIDATGSTCSQTHRTTGVTDTIHCYCCGQEMSTLAPQQQQQSPPPPDRQVRKRRLDLD